jgi:hypothetical protein
MLKGEKISAYGGANHFVDRLRKTDIVLLYHKGYGVIAAGEVLSDKTLTNVINNDERYKKLKFITPVPQTQIDIDNRSIPAPEISQLTGKSFYWASTVKAPYLSKQEAMTIIAELNSK